MERPRLRPLESFVVERDGQKLLALRDPSRLTDAVATLPPLGAAIVQLLDGEMSRDDICVEFERRHRSRLPRDVLDHFLEQLDEAHLLDSQRFAAHSEAVFTAFAHSPIRRAHLAGQSYPASRTALAKQLESYFDPPHGPHRPSDRLGPLPRAIIAPHIDFERGGPAYAWAYKPVAEASYSPELVVLFGTNHMGSERPFALTRKHYDTPLGPLRTDGDLVDQITGAIADELGVAHAETLFGDEHHHRGEHSIEFQMVWLRHALGERADHVAVLPVLCGSLHDFVERGRSPSSDLRIGTLLSAITALTATRRTLFIAGADLAHVGPRFGDRTPLDRGACEALRRRDEATLAAAANGDPEAWFAEIQQEADRRRVCGLAPIYALLQTARLSSGRVAAYAQCPADETGGSVVSIASLVFD